MTSFGATTSQYFPAIRGSHTRAKAMHAFALQIAGLEGSFHGCILIDN
jgi:hypothetical protein